MSQPDIVWHEHDCDCSFCDPVKAKQMTWFTPAEGVRTLTTESLINGKRTEHWRKPNPSSEAGK